MTDTEYKWIAQDKYGGIYKYHEQPTCRKIDWYSFVWQLIEEAQENEAWQSSLINLETHDYKIEDGILMKVEKKNTNRHKHADLMIAKANDKTLQIQHKDGDMWFDVTNPAFHENIQYRIKPKTKTVRFRNFRHNQPGCLGIGLTDNPHEEDIAYFIEWIGDWQEVEIDD